MASAAEFIRIVEVHREPADPAGCFDESEKFVGALRVEIADPDTGSFASRIVGEIAFPSIASRLPLEAVRVIAERRARVNVGAMRIAQELELFADIILIALWNDSIRFSGIGLV